MDKPNSVVCICETQEQARRATYNLYEAGIDRGTLSIATRDNFSDAHGADDYIVGDETFTIPGIGPVLVNGPLAAWIVNAFDNGAGGGGFSIVGAALATLGIPIDCIFQYEAALKTNSFLLVVHGAPNAVAVALKVMGGTTHCSHTVHGEKVFETAHGLSALATSAYSPQA